MQASLVLWLLARMSLSLTQYEYKPANPSCSHSQQFPVCVGKAIFLPEVCEEIIKTANEMNAYDVGYDSIDGKPAVQIDVLEKGEIQHPRLYNLIEPHLPKLTNFIGEHFSVDFIYWIFFRRYSVVGNFERKSVGFHSDSSGATAVIMMNKPDVDFTGGNYTVRAKGREDDRAPKYYPTMEQGSALIHDGVIKHGVAEVTSGTRYTLIVFYSVGQIHATFHNDLDQTVSLYHRYGTDSDYLGTLEPGEEFVKEGTHVKQEYVGLAGGQDDPGEMLVKWRIGFAPAAQNFLTSTDSWALDKDVHVYNNVQSKVFLNELQNERDEL